MTEQELEQVAAGLGARPADAIDTDRIAARVLARLEEDPILAMPRSRGVVRWLAGLAAAAALLFLAGRFLGGPGRFPVEQTATHATVLPELDRLSVDQLEELLQAMPVVNASTLPIEKMPLQELDTMNLERLLRSLEG